MMACIDLESQSRAGGDSSVAQVPIYLKNQLYFLNVPDLIITKTGKLTGGIISTFTLSSLCLLHFSFFYMPFVGSK